MEPVWSAMTVVMLGMTLLSLWVVLYQFEFPVVVQKQWELSKQFGIFATPVAFLINEDGVIARNVAQGIEEIKALVPVLEPAGAKF